jgi:hypothetical protein
MPHERTERPARADATSPTERTSRIGLSPSERTIRIGLVLLGAFPLAAGALALVAPAAFFDEIGRYGAENLHYVGDTGAFSAAYGGALIAAVALPSWRVPLLTLGAAWYGLHALNHVFDVDEARSTARGIADTVALGAGAALLAGLARKARP